jgi:Tfp pilus assembly protein PilF
VVTALTRRLAEALRGSAGVQVVLFQEGVPLLRRAVADQTALGNREAAEPEGGTLVARSAGATHVCRGTLTAYTPPADGRPGRAALHFSVTRVASEVQRSAEAEAPVASRAKPEAVAGVLARAVAETFARALLPSLSVEQPGDRESALATRLRRGREAMEVGGLDEAYRHLSEAVKQAPRDPAANAALGDLLVRRGRMASAIAAYRQSLLFEPGNADVRRQLLRALDAHGLMEELATEARRAIELEVSDAEVWRRLGHACQAQGLAGEAVIAYDRSLSLEPADGETIRERAFLWAATGHAGRAQSLLEPRVRGGAEPGIKEMLQRAQALPADAGAEAKARLPAAGGAFAEAGYRKAAEAAVAEARDLAAEARAAPPSSRNGAEERRRGALSRAGRAHGLVEYWSTWQVTETLQNEHAGIAASLQSVARAALAQAAAEERSWPGAPALITRLWADAERALGSRPGE